MSVDRSGPPADLIADTRVECLRREADGRPALYGTRLSDRWSAAFFPFGGYVSAIALRAMQDAVGAGPHTPRSLTTVFSSPVKEGPVEIEVRTLRAGRGMSQLMATLRNAGTGDAGHTSIAVFGASRDGFDFTEDEPPEIPEPEECEGPKEPPPSHSLFRSSFFEQLEVRHTGMHAPWETDWKGGRAEATRWMRYRVPPRLADGTLDPLAYVPICDTMPPAIGQWIGPREAPFMAPSCDLTVHFLRPTRDEWLLVQARCQAAADGYVSATIHLWDRERRLLAHASQLMYLRLELGETPG